uniref:Uncharacterized protein n=1 Tax=Aegilops tauschii subsp. strangulata TaxID=200361 RepID=A0A453EDP3_AEGTS
FFCAGKRVLFHIRRVTIKRQEFLHTRWILSKPYSSSALCMTIQSQMICYPILHTTNFQENKNSIYHKMTNLSNKVFTG